MTFKKGDKVVQRGQGPFQDRQGMVGTVVNKTWIGCWSYQVKYRRATREFHNGEISKSRTTAEIQSLHLAKMCRKEAL
jgi:hypothetical protein